MDQFRQHVRSTVILTDDLFDQLPRRTLEIDPAADPEVLVVGNTVAPSGATISNHAVTIVADTVTYLGGDDTIDLHANPAAGEAQTGRVGTRLRVIAQHLFGGKGTTQGQKGGKGKKGTDGIHMPPIDQPEPQPNDPPGPPVLVGRSGGKGGDGGDGGKGGPVELFLRAPSTFTAAWLGLGGEAGAPGAGGDPELAPNSNSTDGEPGAPGDPGDPGPDVAATVAVGEAPWRSALNASGAIARWARLRTDLALELFRRNEPARAIDELTAAGVVAGGAMPVLNALAPHLPALVRDHRAITGVARDQELVPDLTVYADAHDARAAQLAAALPDGAVLSGDVTGRLAAIRGQLQSMIAAGGSFTARNNELRSPVPVAVSLMRSLDTRSLRTRKRLTDVLGGIGGPPAAPAIKIGTLDLQAPAVADALAGVLGPAAPFVVPTPAESAEVPTDLHAPYEFQPAGDQATLLPLDLDLLVHRGVRDRGETLPPAALAALRSGAAGMGRIGEWDKVATGQPDSNGQPVTVDLAKVAGELRGATGDRAVVDLLVELAETAHAWRLARARVEQLLAGRQTLAIHESNATAASAEVTNPTPADLLPGVRCLLDDLQWYADRAARASQLLTFGLADPTPPELSDYPFPQDMVTGDIAALVPVLHSPDRELDLRENSPAGFAPSVFDHVVRAVRQRNTRRAYDDYLKRGIPIVGLSPAPLRKVFTAADRPDVLKRFADTGEFWFDAGLADMTGPHAEARVVGIKVSFEFAVAGPGVDVPLRVTHSGLSAQRDMSGTVHRQTLLPAAVELSVVPVTDALAVGEISLNAPGQPPIRPIDFPVYGRGAVASWLVQRQETISVLPDLASITVEVLYEAMVPEGTVSLRSVAFAGAGLRVGADAVITVALTGPAGAGGAQVALSSSDPATVSVPAAVLVPAGQTSAAALAKVLKPTGARPPTLTARTADGVVRQARPVVPAPARPSVAAVRLTPQGQEGSITVAVVPGPAKQPGRVLATVAFSSAENDVSGTPDGAPNAAAFGVLHERRPDTLALVRQTQVGQVPRSLAVDPQRRRIYVANGGTSASVSMLDADTLTPIAERTVGMLVDVEVDTAAGLVYVSLFGAAKILVLSADDLHVVGEISDPQRLRRPHGIAVFPAVPGTDAMIYTARTVRGIENEEAAVTQIRRRANGQHALVRSLDLGPSLTQPVDVAVDTVHKLVFVSCLGGNDVAPVLVVLEHPTMKELHRVRLFTTGRAVESRSGSGLAYVVGEAGLTIVDGRTGLVTTRFQLGDQHLDHGLPISVAVDPGVGTAYVGTRLQSALFRIDAPTDASRVFW